MGYGEAGRTVEMTTEQGINMEQEEETRHRASDKMKEFGLLLQRLREYYKLSQYELSHRSGVPIHTINRLEKGQIPKPGIDDLAKLAKFFNLDLNAMGVLLGVWEEPHEHAIASERLRRSLEELSSLSRELSPPDQEQLSVHLDPILYYWTARVRGQGTAPLPPWLIETLQKRSRGQGST